MIRYITVGLRDNHIEGYGCIADIAKRINMIEAYVINAIRSECLVGHGDSACWALCVPRKAIKDGQTLQCRQHNDRRGHVLRRCCEHCPCI